MTDVPIAGGWSLSKLSKRIRLIAGIITGVVAGAGAAGAIYSSDLMPVSTVTAKAIVKDQVGTAIGQIVTEQKATAAKVSEIQREGAETRLQVNRLRRDAIRATRWKLEEDLRAETAPERRRSINSRIEELKDDLEDATRERDRLRVSSP